MKTAEELNALVNTWPEGSVGYASERERIAELDKIGKAIGYGALHQLAEFLYEIQCHDYTDNAAAMKRERFSLMGWPLPAMFESACNT